MFVVAPEAAVKAIEAEISREHLCINGNVRSRNKSRFYCSLFNISLNMIYYHYKIFNLVFKIKNDLSFMFPNTADKTSFMSYEG